MKIEKDNSYIPDSKVCNRCREDKPITEFRKSKTGRYGLHGFCRTCHDIDSAEKYEANKEKRLAQIEMWNDKNPDKTNKYKNKWNKHSRKEEKRQIKQLEKEIQNIPDSNLNIDIIPDF